MIKVLIADDHQLFRQGLRNLLELERIEVVAEASTGPETLEEALPGSIRVLSRNYPSEPLAETW